MSLTKYLRRFERMHWLIKQSATGSCDNFAGKLRLSRRQLLENISELKEMGAPIKYSHTSSSYYYEHDWQPFEIATAKELNKIRGGKKFSSPLLGLFTNRRLFFCGIHKSAVLPHPGGLFLGSHC